MDLILPIVVAIRLLCAQYSIIPDCDEVFNYWEPTHFLTHGYGLQTWEYSPVYAIRSWAYVGIHAGIINIARILGIEHKQMLFLVLRSVLGVVSALSEARLYRTLKQYSRRVALFYVVFSAASTGMFHGSVSYLPSSFAMYMFTFGMSYFLDKTCKCRRLAFVKGLSFTLFGAIFGWPFAAAMIVPFGVNYVFNCLYAANPRITNGLGCIFKTAWLSFLITVALCIAIVSIDSIFYRKLEFVPYNIVAYNVLYSDDTTGPGIFGTEPWYYYFLNLAMNFNIAFILALASAIVPVFNLFHKSLKMPFMGLVTMISPFFLWLAIFTVQPHKEERFMYVAYPSLCLNAALTLETFSIFAQSLFSAVGLKSVITRRLVVFTVVAAFAILSLSRSSALTIYYGAPINVLDQMHHLSGNVCVGREWYRFPSSYFLRDDQRLKFVKSGFSGLLPGEFIESDDWWWKRKGTWVEPVNMNNKNLEDFSKYVSVDECKLVIDSSLPVDTSVGEIYFTEDFHYVKMKCLRFLNSQQSTGIARVLWIPELLHPYLKTFLVWDEYCLLQQVESFSD